MPPTLTASMISWYKDTVNIDRTCPMCGKPACVHDIPRKQFEDWWRDGRMDGPFAQVAFPDMAPADAEILISGIDDACWQDLFPPEDDGPLEGDLEEEENDEYDAPDEEHDPGPEVDDEGGMSEYRHSEPEERI